MEQQSSIIGVISIIVLVLASFGINTTQSVVAQSDQQIRYSGSFTNTTYNLDGVVTIDMTLGTDNTVYGYINFTNNPGVQPLCGAGNFTGEREGGFVEFSFISDDPDPGCGFDKGLEFTIIAVLWNNETILSGNYFVSSGQAGVFFALSEAATGAISLTGLEVTQGIQNLENEVVLIEEKPTFVRAYVNSIPGRIDDVKAELIGRRNGNPLPKSPLSPSNLGGNIDILGEPGRWLLNDSFYFELPPEWRSGTIELEFQGVGYTPFCQESGGNFPNTQHDCKVIVTFKDTPPFDLLISPVTWKDSNGTPQTPTQADIDNVTQEIEAAYPIPLPLKKDLVPLPVGGTGRPSIQKVNNILHKNRSASGCGKDCQRIYLGVMVDPAEDIKLPGLGQAKSNANVASGYWVNSDQTWTPPGLFGPGNVSFSGKDLRQVLPHELGHRLGPSSWFGFRPHTQTWKPKCPLTAPTLPIWPYPYSTGNISPVTTGDDAVYGFHIFTKQIYHPTTGDLMSYCFPVWPSDWTYEGIHDVIKSRFQKSSQAIAQIKATDLTPTLLVSGQVTPTMNVGHIGPIYTLALDSSIPATTSGTYELQFKDNIGNLLATYPFEPELTCEAWYNCSEDQQTGFFFMEIPHILQTARIELLHNGATLDSRLASAFPPVITVISPNGGENLSGTNATLSWSANDPDNDLLEYIVQYSTNGGVNWQTLASDWPSTTYELDLNFVSGTNQGLIRILASDGFHTTQDQSDAIFTIAKHPPTVNIQSPKDNSLYVENQTIILEGSAYDNEDGLLGDAALSWSSNLDGVLGTGNSLTVAASSMSEGSHLITLTAQDSDNETDSANIVLDVYRNRPTIPASLSVGPPTLYFVAQEGGGSTVSQTLYIRINGDSPTTWWAVSVDQNWISADIFGGAAPINLPVTINPAGLPSGEYTGNITITAPNTENGTQIVKVMLSVQKATYLPIILRQQFGD